MSLIVRADFEMPGHVDMAMAVCVTLAGMSARQFFYGYRTPVPVGG